MIRFLGLSVASRRGVTTARSRGATMTSLTSLRTPCLEFVWTREKKRKYNKEDRARVVVTMVVTMVVLVVMPTTL